jgi:hypothetical protein
MVAMLVGHDAKVSQGRRAVASHRICSRTDDGL